MKVLTPTSREEFIKAQLKKFHRKRDRVFVQDQDLIQIASAFSDNFNDDLFMGLCHGVRTGYECRRLSELLDVPVYGTDIGPVTGEKFFGEWDFHWPRWEGRFDFVYSNSLDHSCDPATALKVWVSQLCKGGLLGIHWSPQHNGRADAADCFVASLEEYKTLVHEITDPLPEVKLLNQHWLVLGRRT